MSAPAPDDFRLERALVSEQLSVRQPRARHTPFRRSRWLTPQSGRGTRGEALDDLRWVDRRIESRTGGREERVGSATQLTPRETESLATNCVDAVIRRRLGL